MKRLCFVIAIVATLVAPPERLKSLLPVQAQAQENRFIQEVVRLDFGTRPGNMDPHFSNVNNIFGPPRGVADGMSGSTDVLSLGVGGQIILRFRNPVIFNGPGYDFTVFENPFFHSYGGHPTGSVWMETATVAVSSDGLFFLEFPTDYIVQSPPIIPGASADANPDHYVGFAGVRPVFSHPNNGIDPLDPSVSGGDPFDLELLIGLPGSDKIDFDNIRYVRIRDTGENPVDSQGDPLPEYTLPGDQGFDLDALAVINAKPETGLTGVSGTNWASYR